MKAETDSAGCMLEQMFSFHEYDGFLEGKMRVHIITYFLIGCRDRGH